MANVGEGEELVIVVSEGVMIIGEELVISVFDTRLDAATLATVNVIGVSASVINSTSNIAAIGTTVVGADGTAPVDVFAIHLSGLIR